MANLTSEFFSQPGAIDLIEGEQVMEATTNGEYYDYKAFEAKKCYLVFTNKGLRVYVDGKPKGGFFKKAQPTVNLVIQASYDSIESLNRMKVGGDDSFCRAHLKSGNDVSFNIFGEVFGPLAAKVVKYSGLDIPRNSTIKS